MTETHEMNEPNGGFDKYQHIERLGVPEVEGILDGACYIFPKLDGTNGQVWRDGEKVRTGSRNRECTIDNDNQGFAKYINECPEYEAFFRENRDIRLYGEFLIKYTIKDYVSDAWGHFYVFDVQRDGLYLRYEEYKELLEPYGIRVIPHILILQNPGQEELNALLDENTYLMKPECIGEGIVIKNYDYLNCYGRKTWAKIVRAEFKQKRRPTVPHEQEDPADVHERIVERYMTDAFVEKTKAKICDGQPWSDKMIGALLSRCYNEMLQEEIVHIIKDFKGPTIDFRQLNRVAIAKIKSVIHV